MLIHYKFKWLSMSISSFTQNSYFALPKKKPQYHFTTFFYMLISDIYTPTPWLLSTESAKSFLKFPSPLTKLPNFGKNRNQLILKIYPHCVWYINISLSVGSQAIMHTHPPSSFYLPSLATWEHFLSEWSICSGALHAYLQEQRCG